MLNLIIFNSKFIITGIKLNGNHSDNKLEEDHRWYHIMPLITCIK